MSKVCKCGRPSGTRKLCDLCALTGIKKQKDTFRKRFFTNRGNQLKKEREEYESISGVRVLGPS
jgi:hypothetical protein